jgi:flagellar hook-associated protein 3 FlgL
MSITEASQLSLRRMQAKLADGQKEVATSRHADVGLELGYKFSTTLSLRNDYDRTKSVMDTNASTKARLDISQNALDAITKNAQDFIGNLLGARDTITGPGVLATQGVTGLKSLIDTLNTSIGGVNVFSGIQVDQNPMKQYFDQPPPASKQAVDSAFSAAFGMSQSDPNVSTISASQMQNFLDTSFDGLFQDPNWQANWSSASSTDVQTRISKTEIIQTSVNANDPAFRKLVSAYAMIADLGTAKLSQGAYQAVVDKATKLVGDAVQGLSNMQSTLGVAQERVTKADQRMSIQIDVMQKQITGLEGVDPYEASTHVSALLTQIETSYALTARVQKLSLLNYL